MSQSPTTRTLPGAGPWWEARASLAFVERNLYLVRRYWHLELAFLIFNVASAMSVLYIGKAQMEMGGGGNAEGQLDLVLFLGIGTVVWAYLRAVFANVGEMVAWERWEGTIEYTMMAPISRLAHMLGVSMFSIIYGLLRSALLLGVLSLFFSVDLSQANIPGATVILLAGSISFLGFGIMAAVLPLLFPERGEEMTFVISSILLLVSGIYYPISVLPGWMQPLATVSPATYVLEGMRAALLDGKSTQELVPFLWPILLIGALAVPVGIAIFNWGERYAKRTGRLKRSG
ncbi:MAG: ABC transporter permease [Thermomicrobiales bacterium]